MKSLVHALCAEEMRLTPFYEKAEICEDELEQNLRKMKRLNQRWKRISNKWWHLSDYLDKLCEQYDEELNTNGKGFGDPEMMALNKRISQFEQKMYQAEKDKIAIEMEREIYHELAMGLFDEQAGIQAKIDKTSWRLNSRTCRVIHLTKKKARQLETNECAICMDPHRAKDMATTSCGHSFGKTCFDELIEKTCRINKTLCCPLCRNEQMQMTIYRTGKK